MDQRGPSYLSRNPAGRVLDFRITLKQYQIRSSSRQNHLFVSVFICGKSSCPQGARIGAANFSSARPSSGNFALFKLLGVTSDDGHLMSICEFNDFRLVEKDSAIRFDGKDSHSRFMHSLERA